jgi:hypothetical protein
MAVEEADSFFDPLDETDEPEDFFDIDVTVDEDPHGPVGVAEPHQGGTHAADFQAGPLLHPGSWSFNERLRITCSI